MGKSFPFSQKRGKFFPFFESTRAKQAYFASASALRPRCYAGLEASFRRMTGRSQPAEFANQHQDPTDWLIQSSATNLAAWGAFKAPS
jgi:hypothetical protein